jgi:hypothetical protein
MTTDFKSSRPGREEYPPYFEGYVSLVGEGDLVEILGRQIEVTAELLRGVAEERAGEAYEPGKWSVKELVGHLLDAERVFAYRVLCIARGDTASLPGMDQDTYVRGANFNARTLSDLVGELERVRATTLDLLRSLDREAWGRHGVANGNEITVRALAHVIAGHEAHHVRVLRERYLGAGVE